MCSPKRRRPPAAKRQVVRPVTGAQPVIRPRRQYRRRPTNSSASMLSALDAKHLYFGAAASNLWPWPSNQSENSNRDDVVNEQSSVERLHSNQAMTWKHCFFSENYNYILNFNRELGCGHFYEATSLRESWIVLNRTSIWNSFVVNRDIEKWRSNFSKRFNSLQQFTWQWLSRCAFCYKMALLIGSTSAWKNEFQWDPDLKLCVHAGYLIGRSFSASLIMNNNRFEATSTPKADVVDAEPNGRTNRDGHRQVVCRRFWGALFICIEWLMPSMKSLVAATAAAIAAEPALRFERLFF